jgi:hypothetical protein
VRLAATVEPPPQSAQVADELVAGVDGYQKAFGATVVGPGPTRNASTSGSRASRARIDATTSAQVSRGSSDSVAPAGPG